jgi:hypothetical protein
MAPNWSLLWCFVKLNLYNSSKASLIIWLSKTPTKPFSNKHKKSINTSLKDTLSLIAGPFRKAKSPDIGFFQQSPRVKIGSQFNQNG